MTTVLFQQFFHDFIFRYICYVCPPVVQSPEHIDLCVRAEIMSNG